MIGAVVRVGRVGEEHEHVAAPVALPADLDARRVIALRLRGMGLVDERHKLVGNGGVDKLGVLRLAVQLRDAVRIALAALVQQIGDGVFLLHLLAGRRPRSGGFRRLAFDGRFVRPHGERGDLGRAAGRQQQAERSQQRGNELFHEKIPPWMFCSVRRERKRDVPDGQRRREVRSVKRTDAIGACRFNGSRYETTVRHRASRTPLPYNAPMIQAARGYPGRPVSIIGNLPCALPSPVCAPPSCGRSARRPG